MLDACVYMCVRVSGLCVRTRACTSCRRVQTHMAMYICATMHVCVHT